MKLCARILITAVLALAFHWFAMSLAHDQHYKMAGAPGTVMSCPVGYVCPAAPAALRLALPPAPALIGSFLPLATAAFALVILLFIAQAYRPPLFIPLPTSPPGLLSIFKRE